MRDALRLLLAALSTFVPEPRAVKRARELAALEYQGRPRTNWAELMDGAQMWTVPLA